LRHDIVPLVGDLARISGIDDIALTTNGSALSRARAISLKDAGLTRVTVSIDSLDPNRFGRINGVGFPVNRVLEAIDNAAEAGLSPIKINVVIKRGLNGMDVVPLAKRFRFSGHTVRYIEYMDVGASNGWLPKDVVPALEILEMLSTEWTLHPVEPAYYGEVASRYAYDDGGGEIGFISSVSQPFCGSCTRARLSADGRLLLCLFADEGVSLRDIMRHGATEQDLIDTVRTIWKGRDDRYSDLRNGDASRSTKRLEMFQIGG